MQAQVKGIELRPDLVQQSQQVIADLGLQGMHMQQGEVACHGPPRMNLMIALHPYARGSVVDGRPGECSKSIQAFEKPIFREAQACYWADGETGHERNGDELPGTPLRGRLDRLEHGPDGQRQVIDCKTDEAAALSRKVKQQLEGTQLAFCATLL